VKRFDQSIFETVELEARGQFIFYTLADEAVLDLVSALRRIAERNIAA
jgi:hypothetical protein